MLRKVLISVIHMQKQSSGYLGGYGPLHVGRWAQQDFLLCRTMVALFDDKFLSSQIAMRGGTLMHKLHLAPASRYSEDIDLVVVGPRSADHIRRSISRVLADVLGMPKTSVWDTLKLAIRNTVTQDV
jgi:hypothetical protein